jgi:hypothetical protein
LGGLAVHGLQVHLDGRRLVKDSFGGASLGR